MYECKKKADPNQPKPSEPARDTTRREPTPLERRQWNEHSDYYENDRR